MCSFARAGLATLAVGLSVFLAGALLVRADGAALASFAALLFVDAALLVVALSSCFSSCGAVN